MEGVTLPQRFPLTALGRLPRASRKRETCVLWQPDDVTTGRSPLVPSVCLLPGKSAGLKLTNTGITNLSC